MHPPLSVVFVLFQVWVVFADDLELDQIHNSSGFQKIMAGINDLAASVGKIGLKLFNANESAPVVRVHEYHVQETWEATTWSSVNAHEAYYHGAPGGNSSRVEDHEAAYHGKPRASQTLAEHEEQYHGSDAGHHTHSLKEHEAKYHNNRNAPCSDLKQHEVKHHGRSANMQEHEKKYHGANRVGYNSVIADHETEFHDVKENHSASLEQHIARFHRNEKYDRNLEEFEKVKYHEETLHGQPRCPYKVACKFITDNAHYLLWGSAALLTLFML